MTTAPESREQRNWFLTGWLALIIVFNLFTIISFLTGGNNPLQYALPAEETPQWPILLTVIGAVVAVFSCAAIMMKLRLGWYGLVISYFVMTISSLVIGFNIISVLFAGVVFLVTWVLLRPDWSRMK